VDEDDWRCLNECWNDLQNQRWPWSLGNYFEISGTNLMEHLHWGLCALFATCAAAAHFKRKTPGQVSSWLRRSASLLDAVIPPDPLAIEDLNVYENRLVKQKCRIPATLHWMRWWLGAASGGHRVEVPIVGVAGGMDSARIVLLHFERLSGFETDRAETASRPPRPIPHPASALYPVEADFMEPIKTITDAFAFPVCWRVTGLDGLPLKRRTFSGNSAGGAAARALWHLHEEKFVDPGVLVLASVEPQAGWNPKISGFREKPAWSELKLKQVGESAAKLAAAKKDDRIDTIIEVSGLGDLIIRDRAEGWNPRSSVKMASAE